MNLKEKTKMAHEYAIEMAKQGISLRPCKELGWKYADAMEAEYSKRKQAEAEKNAEDAKVFFDKLTVADSPQLDFQVDWSVAPNDVDAWIQHKNLEYCWLTYNVGYKIYIRHSLAPSFDYRGDWKDSLRKRPK